MSALLLYAACRYGLTLGDGSYTKYRGNNNLIIIIIIIIIIKSHWTAWPALIGQVQKSTLYFCSV